MGIREAALIYELSLIGLVIITTAGVIEVAILWGARLNRWYRRRKIDRRVIEQAKALEVWDKKPIVLGGRALELKAWEEYRIKRKAGESDPHLRRRCMVAEHRTAESKGETEK